MGGRQLRGGGGGGEPAVVRLEAAMRKAEAAVPDAWFEERDTYGHALFIHLDGKRTTRERPTKGKVYGMLSYGMFGPELGTPFFGN
jgi:hypothetical protein